MTLIKSDFQAIRKLVRLEINEALEQKLEQKLEEKLEQKLGRYPTKDEFYAAMDKLMKELETIRQELTLTPSQFNLQFCGATLFQLKTASILLYSSL